MTPAVLANLGYVLMLGAFLARDSLVLRSVLAVAQTFLAAYGWFAALPVVAAWNVAFLGINTYMAAEVLRERRAVTLPPDLAAIHARHFAALSPGEFLRWWRQGTRERLDAAVLARTGERPEWLTFLLSGAVRVRRDGRDVTTLTGGFFVAEMSLITGRPANADVDIVEPSDIVRWSRADLERLRDTQPVLWTKIQSAIGLDLVEKIRRSES